MANWKARAVTTLLVVALLAAAPFGLWLSQRRLIYFPTRYVPPLEQLLPGWEEATLRTDDDLDLGAWYLPPEPDAPVVIVFNGNAGNRGDRVALGAALEAQGVGVLLVDYRGYGSNDGSPTEEGLALDARAARRFVDAQAPGHPICYFGESLGAAVAIELATEKPPDALVLRSPFTSLADVARVHYRLLPVGVMLRDRYPSLGRIGSIDVPLLVIAGSVDSIVPVGQSEELYTAAARPYRLLIVEGADHNDYALLAGPELIEAVRELLRSVS